MIYQLFKYIVVGTGNAAIDIGVLNLLVQIFHWPLIPANTLSASLAITNSYIWHKYWTFGDKRPDHLRQLPLFIMVNLIGIAVYDVLIHFGTQLLIGWFPEWPYWWQYNLAKIVSAAIFTIFSYLTYKFIIFRQRD
ncbi:GtrA family protein [Patescibacteria group bacterium]|nr:GtrA family protein [Patescibacteria group bacterium]